MDTHPIRVLLVDDDQDDYIITRDLLSEIEVGRFDLDWIATYDAALETIGRNNHDVYLLDYRLGERNGLQLMREAIKNGCKAPMILLTGQGDREIDVEAMKAGAADYLTKGQIGAAILERSIRYAIERARLVEGLEMEVAARTAEIQAEKEKSETILRSVGDAIVMSGLKMDIRYVNPAFSTITGYAAQEVMGKHLGLLFKEKLTGQDQHTLELALTQGDVWQGEVTARRKDGRTYEAALTIAPMRDAQGRLVGYVSSHRDISRLKELDRARSQFITSVSHQLRTPVTNLKLYTRLLQSGQGQARTDLYLQVLDEQASRLCDLIQDILEMTELDSGKVMAKPEPVHLSVIIGAIITRFQDQAQAASLTLTAMPLPPTLPKVKGDPAQLTRTLGELVKNAVLFTPAGGQVTIKVKTVKDQEGTWVTIAVSDTGPGIPPQEQPRIFDRFFRGEVVKSGHIPGTGLGLCKAQEIMNAHGGKITLVSDGVPGQGSTFTLWLPHIPDQIESLAAIKGQ